MLKKQMTIENIPDEDVSYSDDDLYNINSWGADLSFRELISMYEENELLKPELQRKYVWTKDEASRFIDSILLGLPVPSIFLAKDGTQKLIIDGYQRIMTVVDFVKGIFSDSGKVFKLSNSESINKRWRGKAFVELLSEEQRRIKSYTIHCIIFEQKKPQDNTGMYQIFERINTTGKVLKPQEIRNCVYHGPFNSLIMDLNKKNYWRRILGSDIEDTRMADVELILRFFAFEDLKNQPALGQRQIILKKYLNEYMGKMNNADAKMLSSKAELFERTMSLIDRMLGEQAFCNIRNIAAGSALPVFIPKVHPTIFDAITVATSYAISATNIQKDSQFKDRQIILLENSDFREATSRRTTNIDNIKSRIPLAAKYLYEVDYEW